MAKVGKMILSKISRTLRVTGKTKLLPTVNYRTTPAHSAPLPAFLVLLAKPLAAASAALLGRSFRMVWARVSPERKRALRSKWTKPICVTGVLMSGCASYGYFSHIQVCPYTGRRKFVALSKEQVRGSNNRTTQHPFYLPIIGRENIRRPAWGDT